MRNLSQKNKLVWLIVFLAILNLSTLATIGFHIYQSKKVENLNFASPPQHGKMQQYNGRSFRDFLNLDADQMDSFRNINWEFRQNARDINFQLINKRSLMLKEMSASNSDTVLLNNLSDAIGILHAQLKKETYKYYLNIKDICNPKQQKKLNEIFNEFFINDMGFDRGGKGNQYRHGRGKNQSN